MREAETTARLLDTIRSKRQEESRLRTLEASFRTAKTFEEIRRVGDLVGESRALIRAHADVMVLCGLSLAHDYARQQSTALDSAASLDKAIEDLRTAMARRHQEGRST